MKKIVKLNGNEIILVYSGSYPEEAIKEGFVEKDCELGYNDILYLKGFAPKQSIDEKNEEIRAKREILYSSRPCSDYKYKYDEDVARYGLESPEALASKKIWLDKKDEIRENNPYFQIEEEI